MYHAKLTIVRLFEIVKITNGILILNYILEKTLTDNYITITLLGDRLIKKRVKIVNGVTDIVRYLFWIINASKHQINFFV